jgi:hypothetical protein
MGAAIGWPRAVCSSASVPRRGKVNLSSPRTERWLRIAALACFAAAVIGILLIIFGVW